MNKVFWADMDKVVRSKGERAHLHNGLNVDELFFGLADGESGEIKSYDAVFGVRKDDEWVVYLYRGAYYDCVDESAEEFVKSNGVDFTAVYDIATEGLTGTATVSRIAQAKNLTGAGVSFMKEVAESVLKAMA